jgi:predicted phage terminase large subunit-like protein
MAGTATVSLRDLLNVDVDAELARRHHLDFMKLVWAKYDPFVVGHHTVEICKRLDQAVADYRDGKSTFLVITVPFRHGKSDIISRYFPPHFLGEFPNAEVMVASYAAEHANGLSRFARDNVLSSMNYYRVYPDIVLDPEIHNVQNWKITSRSGKKYTGETHWVGIGGGSTGKGYNVGLIDDYLKNRKDAESEQIRDAQWSWLKDVFLTRRAPVSITIILCTPWHVDDMIGRIEREMMNNPDFPKFDRITFPAFDESYDQGVLFPERFSQDWYRTQKGTLGSYGTASLLQCSPFQKGGAILDTAKFQFIDRSEVPEGLPTIRMWDLASSEKELEKDDPDYTAGLMMAVDWGWNEVINERTGKVYLIHATRCQEKAPARNRHINQHTEMDGASVRIGVESVGGYKDTFDQMDAALSGSRMVEKITVSKDKRVRIAELEPIIEAGNFYIVRGDWNQDFVTEANQFPNGKHDDQIDALSGGFEALKNDVSFTDADKVSYQKRTRNS